MNGPEEAAQVAHGDAVLAQMLAHRSVRRFADTAVPDADVERAVAAAQRAATSHLVQSYALLRVRSPQTRAQIAELAGGQAHVREAGAFFVVLGDQHRHRLVLEAAKVPYCASLEPFLVSVIDAALFAQNLTLAFEAMGYGTCYIGGLRNQPAALDGLLGTPQGAFALFGLCVGVPAERPEALPRLPVGAVLFEERYPSAPELAQSISAYDRAFGAYQERVRGKSGRTWSQQILRLFGAPQRTSLAAHYLSKGADLR